MSVDLPRKILITQKDSSSAPRNILPAIQFLPRKVLPAGEEGLPVHVRGLEELVEVERQLDAQALRDRAVGELKVHLGQFREHVGTLAVQRLLDLRKV